MFQIVKILISLLWQIEDKLEDMTKAILYMYVLYS